MMRKAKYKIENDGKKKMKICFRCKREILDKENYYSFTEFNDEKIIKVDYAHRKCWDEFLKSVGDTTEAMGMLRGLKGSLTKMGMLPPEKEVIQI